MFGALLVFLCAVFSPLLFVGYCRWLLARNSRIELSETVLKAIGTERATVSSDDFHRLRALVRLCPMGQKDRASLAAVSVYQFLLTGLYAIASRICGAFSDWTERERRRCSYFVAVALDRRIANARKLWAEQMIHPEQ